MKYLFFFVILALSISSTAQVGIGIPTPNAQAALDITSTTQGLLPPRMNSTQRNTITSTPAGLVIYNTTTTSLECYDGTAWVSLTPSPTYSIGLHPELGGYVFYLTVDGKHGMVAATQDQSNFSNWYSAQDNISTPANHTSDGKKFRDWRMPTKYELNEMYTQRIAIGGFAINWYWSSSEGTSLIAWLQNFNGVNQGNANKDYSNYVRAVRDF